MSKRQAGTQITKDRGDEEEDWGRDGPPDPVEEASAEVLATRKIALPKSRRRNQDTNNDDSEQKKPNPFSFGIPTTSSDASSPISKPNPFASVGHTENGTKPFGAGASSTASAAPTFSFGSATAQASSSIETDKETQTAKSSNQNSQSAFNDDQFDTLLKHRSINVSFSKAVAACLENDAFADLTKICQEYQRHRSSIQAVQVVAAKNTTSSGTDIYPSISKPPTSDNATPLAESQAQEVSKAPSFAFNATAPSFSFGAAAAISTTPIFTFGQKPEVQAKNDTEKSEIDVDTTSKTTNDENPLKTSQAPAFTFGQTSAKVIDTPVTAPTFSFGQPSKKTEKTDSQISEETPKKPIETKSNDFSWTPDRGIKFGDGSKTSDAKATPPVFGFQNPLASPNQSSTTDKVVSPKPPSTGFSFGSTSNTGFSFGQPSTQPATESKDASSSKTPAFSFGSSAPSFSFGQSTTPSFSFQAGPKSDAADKPETTKESTTATPEAEGDAMPEEPRTNDALVAGPGAGEEDENEVYSVPRAKLFKFNIENSANPWTDLGICVVRVLVHKETEKARIVARAEGAGALRLNARMYPHFKYSLEGKSNAKVYDLVSASKTETYLIKMKEKETATALVKVLNERKK